MKDGSNCYTLTRDGWAMGRPPEIRRDGRDALARAVEGASHSERSTLSLCKRFFVTANLTIFNFGDKRGQR